MLPLYQGKRIKKERDGGEEDGREREEQEQE